MGVIINGQERKSVVEQVEENSKYNVRFVSSDTTIYEKDLPCLVRVMSIHTEGGNMPVKIKAGNGTTLFTITDEGKIKDLFIKRYYVDKAIIYDINGTSLTLKWSPYGQNDEALIIDTGDTTYTIVMPLKFV